MPYQQLLVGANLSQFAASIETQHEQMRSLERGNLAMGEPQIKPTGLLWNRTDWPGIGEAILRWNGSAWFLILDPDHAQINAGGTVAFTANQPMATKILTGLGAGTAAGHSVRFEQSILTTGNNAFAANQSMGGFRLTNLGAPVGDNDAARKIDLATGTGKFFRTTGAGAGLIYSNWTPGTTNFNQIINQTNFVPGSAEIVIRGRLLRADDLVQVEAEFLLNVRVPRWRHETTNGGTFRHVAGWMAGFSATGGTTTVQAVKGEFDNAQAANWDWRSDPIAGNAGVNWRLYVRFHVGATKGVEFWLRTDSSNKYIDIDEVGGGGEGICQLMVFGDAS